MTVLAFEPTIDELGNLGGVGAFAHLVTKTGVHQHHGSLGEQTQVRGSSFAGGHVQRERNIDGHPIEARPFNGLGQFKHGNARRVNRVAFGMRNGKTGDKASLGLVFTRNEGGLYGRCVIGKAELDCLLGQIMQGILARGGGIPDRPWLADTNPVEVFLTTQT